MAKKFENPSKEENERLEALMNKVENDERYPDVEVPADFHEKLAKQIEEYKKQERVEENARVLLSDEDKEALRIGREILEKEKRNTPYRRRKKKAYLLVAAVLILTLAFGVIGVGARGNIVEFIADLFGGVNREVIETAGDETIETELSEEEQAYEDVETLFEVPVVRINLENEGLKFESGNIDEELRKVSFVYEIGEGKCLYQIYENTVNTSHAWIKEEKTIEVFYINHVGQEFEVEVYENLETSELEYSTTFEHKNLSYTLYGSVSKDDFEEILKNLLFF